VNSNAEAVAFIKTAECKELWLEVSECFDLVGFTAKEKDELFAILSGILWLGDVEFAGEDKAGIVSSGNVLDTACRQLGLTSDAMEGRGVSLALKSSLSLH
jgi:myosin heavy subunit